MEKLLESAAVQAPGLVVLVILVIVFLKHMRERDVSIESMNRENLEARAHSRSVIEHNSEIVGHNSEICAQMTATMKELITKISNV